ncbi:hypothetical protein CAC42_6292 [Sphaceloma murrayae]|uniref:NAD(P)-binding protein n=1 Tax=Sphaceloma murrayae TaxID=2082308 RepID=A0A2K1QTV0_9PEZI|nr:hypothetical protein CAC42_6292 [Sphaceloma murrayae]
MSAAKHIVPVTGGNRGIGFEIARQLLADSTKHGLLGSRFVQKGEAAVADLRSQGQPGTVELLHLDVSSESSIQAAAQTVSSTHGRVDALVNNAAVAVPEGTLSQQMTTCFLTNATGPAITGEAFEPLLRKSIGTPRVLNVSSGMGSITSRLDPGSAMYKHSGIQYRASKAAMNMVSADQAARFGEFGAKVFAYCPGFTVSNLSGMTKAENGPRSTEESVRPMVAVLNGERNGEHGGFLYAFLLGQYGW